MSRGSDAGRLHATERPSAICLADKSVRVQHVDGCEAQRPAGTGSRQVVRQNELRLSVVFVMSFSPAPTSPVLSGPSPQRTPVRRRPRRPWVILAALILAALILAAAPLLGGSVLSSSGPEPRNEGPVPVASVVAEKRSTARAATTSCAARTARFAGANWPPGCWRPYGSKSPFNRRLKANVPLDPKSARVVRQTQKWNKPQSLLVGHPDGNRSDYGHPIYYARRSDPLYTIRCTRWRSSCEVDGMRVRIPERARPASGGDAHMAVIDTRRRWEYDFWEVQHNRLPRGGGTITISHGGRTRWGTASSDGLGSNATAAHFGLAAGVLRAEEWNAAVKRGGTIKHALFIAVRCTAGYSVYPAAPGTTGSTCRDEGERSNAPPLGARFFLDLTNEQIEALSVPRWKKPILKAMARYGMIVGDTIGGNVHSWGIWAESDVQYRALGRAGRYAQLGEKWNARTHRGAYVFDIASGVDWSKLRMVPPCASRGSC